MRWAVTRIEKDSGRRQSGPGAAKRTASVRTRRSWLGRSCRRVGPHDVNGQQKRGKQQQAREKVWRAGKMKGSFSRNGYREDLSKKRRPRHASYGAKRIDCTLEFSL